MTSAAQATVLYLILAPALRPGVARGSYDPVGCSKGLVSLCGDGIRGSQEPRKISVPGDKSREVYEMEVGLGAKQLLKIGWVDGERLGVNDNGVTIPIGPPAGILLLEDDEDPIYLRHFLAPAVRPTSPRGQYEVPPPWFRQNTYPFVVGLHNVKAWDWIKKRHPDYAKTDHPDDGLAYASPTFLVPASAHATRTPAVPSSTKATQIPPISLRLTPPYLCQCKPAPDPVI